jgi:hypothetical protein
MEGPSDIEIRQIFAPEDFAPVDPDGEIAPTRRSCGRRSRRRSRSGYRSFSFALGRQSAA